MITEQQGRGLQHQSEAEDVIQAESRKGETMSPNPKQRDVT